MTNKFFNVIIGFSLLIITDPAEVNTRESFADGTLGLLLHNRHV